MAYTPKSKVIFLETSGNEFIYKSTKKEYVGSYIETSDGKFFVGKNIQAIGPELVKPSDTLVNFGSGKDFNTYKNLKLKTYKFLSKTKEVPTTKSIPSEKDYERGYFDRFFI